MWPAVFLLGQALSFAVVQPAICGLQAWYLDKVRRHGNAGQLLFVCRWLRESLVVYEDFQFTVQFQKARYS